MAREGVFHRERKPGGRYHYVLAEAYRPRWPGKENRGVSVPEKGVPQVETQKTNPTKQYEKRFAGLGDALPRPVDWAPRLRCWRKSRFWLPLWGPKPSEPGCFVPAELL
jgi:hypothetical protein